MAKRDLAFTLVETLVVIGIVAVLAGLIFLVFARAKVSAKFETSKQYLRQQYMTIEMYAQENEGRLPDWSVVRSNPRMRAPLSPTDRWKVPGWTRNAPMLGSFAYAVPMADQLDYSVVATSGPAPLLVDAFSADYRLGEFDGPAPPSAQACLLAGTCEYPERLWFVYTDGGLRVQRNPVPVSEFAPGVGRTRELFTWYGAFNRQKRRDAKGE